MKNRLLVSISLLLTILAFYALDIIHAPWIVGILIATILAQVWILIKNKSNWGVRIGNYSLWVTVLVAIVGLVLANTLPSGAMGFGDSFAAAIISLMICLALVTLSCVSFIIGALIPDKSKVVSPNL